jgi:maltose alpha-D-glucosyltransferase / alpha-amylase
MGNFSRYIRPDVYRIRQHGYYHLGQVLFTGHDFFIIDFEGDPTRPLSERRKKGSALRDVASMLRSFHYAVRATLGEGVVQSALGEGERGNLEAWGEVWYREVGGAFLRGYLQVTLGAAFLLTDPSEVNFFLRGFLLEKAFREAVYELNHRPSWLHIPLSGVRSIGDLGSPPELDSVPRRPFSEILCGLMAPMGARIGSRIGSGGMP